MAFRLERFSMRRWGSLSYVFGVAINFLLFSAVSHADTFLHQYTVGKNIGSSVAIDEDGNRYVGSADGNVYAISQSGEEWHFSIGAEVGGTPAVGSESVLFVGSYDGHLYAIDTLNRQEFWSFDTGYPIYSSAAVSLDGTVFIGNRSGDFFAIDGSNGDLKWRVQLGAEIGSSAVIGPRGHVYFGTADGSIYALDASTGSIEFEYSVGGEVSSPAVDWFGNVYFGSYGDRLTALDGDGNLLWEVNVDGRIASSPVVAHDGSVIAVTYDSGTVYAVSPEGSVASTLSLSSSVYSSPAIGPDNSVYVATTSGTIYSLDYSDGNLSITSQYNHDSGFYSSSSLSATNQLYLVSKNGELLERSIDAGSEGPAQWAMFGYSDRHNRVHPNGDGDHCPDAVDVFLDEADKCFDTDEDGIADVYDDDTDGDGLPDDFELAYGLDPLVDDAEEDLDGDGYTNEYEHEQGLDPSENEFDDRPMALVETHDLSGGSGQVAVHPSGDYVVAAAGSLLTSYERDAETGALTEWSSQRIIPTMSKFTANAVAFSGDGEHLYLVGAKEPIWGTTESQQQLYHYQFDENNGPGLREMFELHEADNGTVMEAGVAYEGTVIKEASLALSPQGEHLYLGVRGRGILIFDRDASTGDLNFREHYLNDGTLFDAAYGLVMSEDGAWVYARGYNDLWVLARDESSGALAPHREIMNATSYTEPSVVAGFGSTSALYMPGSRLVETGRDQVERSGNINIRYGWLFSNPSAGLAYTYSSNTLSAYYPDGDSLALLGKLSEMEAFGGSAWATAVASPDGRHIYAKSDSDGKLIVMTAGFKGRERPDRDDDGVEDIFDEFPDNPDEWVDTDGDGIGNNQDEDDDDDGVIDSEDAFPLVENEWLDTDGNGIGNNEDDDDDGDGYKDSEDAFPLDGTEWADADNDGIGDNSDPDDDNDGMSDVWEEANGLDPYDPSDASLNTDGDNLTNLEEFKNDSDPTKADTDGDGYPDHEDQMPRDPEEYRDHDGDGIGDAADPDDDNDGLSDVCEEQYGFDPWTANPPGQDTDGDGVMDDLECNAGTDPTLTDTDGDGLPDNFELAYGLDPLVDDAKEDLDGDGYTNEYEHEQGLDPSENEFDDRPMDLVETHDLSGGSGQVAVHPSGEYVVAAAGPFLTTYERDAETGALTEWSSQRIIPTMSKFTANAVAFSGNGEHLYLVGAKEPLFSSGGDRQQLYHYQFDENNGPSLREMFELHEADNGSVMEAGVAYEGTVITEASLALSPQGEHLYLGVRGRGILIFDRDASTGDLTFRDHYLNDGTLFDAAYGLVMSEDGAWLYAQGYDELWVVSRDETNGTLTPYREITNATTSYPERGVVAGLGSTSALYMTGNGYGGNSLIETTHDQVERRGSINIRYGWLFSSPSAGLAYTYSGSTLSAYYPDGDSLALLGKLSGMEEFGGSAWATAVASPDGQHIYAKSASDGKLIVMTAGFKGRERPDRDDDGVEDIFDEFPDDPDEWVDTDGDGIGNNQDEDDDDDGVVDSEDAFPLDENEWLDTDGNGIGNNEDDDDDGDGYKDSEDAFPLDGTEWADADNDGIGGNSDPDDDNDGISDVWEEANGLNPLDPSDASLNADGDNLSNLEEFENDSDPTKADTDGDGYLDHEDQMPRDPDEYRDYDGDGIGDTADLDDDNDGLSDACEEQYGFDPWTANPSGQDTDGDGVMDDLECNAGTDPTRPDTDGDGLPDAFELAYGLDPLVDDAQEDLDGDGYTNEYEYEQGLDPSENEFDDRPMELVETHELYGEDGQVAVHPSGDYVVVSAGSKLLSYGRDGETGELTKLSELIAEGTAHSMTFSANGNDLYLTGNEKTSFPAQQLLHHYKFSDSGEVTFANSHELQVVDNGTEMEAGVAYAGTSLAESAVTLSPQGQHLYLGVRGRGILIFDRDVTTGGLSFRSHYLNEGTLFDGAYGLVMSEDGAWVYAQGRNDLWVLARDQSDGALTPHREITNASSLNPGPGVVGFGEAAALYMTGHGYNGNSLIETTHDQVERSGTINIRYGWLFSNPTAGLAYTYSSSTLSAYYRDGASLELLGTLSGTEELGGGSWDTAVASPDGRHLYAKSDSNGKLIVATAGFKGLGHPDSDGDSIPDKDDAFPFDPDEWVDSDGDGYGDNGDAFPEDGTEWSDLDGDGIGDNSDPDIDGDECLNGDDVFERDPLECLDTDGDGIGNNQDQDDDGDRLPDEWELANGLDPLDASDATGDLDGDGLNNEDEYHLHQTKANELDSDGDGMDDGWEVEYQLNPNDVADGQMDPDGDGYSSAEEYLAETDPSDPRWYPGAPGLAKWKAQTGDAIRTRAAVDLNGTSYIGSDDGYLYAYDSDGNQLWSFDTGARLRSSPALLQSGEIVIGTSDGQLLKIDPLSPYESIVLGTASGAIETTPEVSEFGIVYFGSDDGHVYSVNAETGEELWKYDTGAPVRSSPRMGADGTVYVGSDSGEVHAIHGESGAPVN